MKKTKRIVSVLLSIVIITGCLFNSLQGTAAKRRDATAMITSAEDYGLHVMCRSEILAVAVSEFIFNKMDSGQTKTLNFSKASHRRYVLKYFGCYRPYDNPEIGNSIGIISKRFFGVSTPKVKILYGDVGVDKPYIGWGEQTFIYKVGANKYEADWNVYMNGPTSVFETIGTVTYILKKAKNKFGWNIKSVKIKKL